MRKLKKSKQVNKDILHKTPIQKGAVIILANMIFLPLLAWGGASIVSAKERIARLEERRQTQKELIIGVDSKVKEQRKDIKEVNRKLDKILFLINDL